jgi:hypothetical protein
MKSLTEIYDLAQNLNEEAHRLAWDTWVAADELMESDDDADWETAEVMREEASEEQAAHFRDLFWDLDKEDQVAVIHWLKEDTDFRDEFSTWFGEQEFDEEFES